MISLQQFRRFFVTLSLSVVLATTAAFGFGTGNSLAAPLSLSSISESHGQLIALWGSGTAKSLEGKTQELVGNVTGDPKDQVMGKAKQVEGQVRKTAADVQDKLELQGGAKAFTKNLEGKAQESMGKASGNLGDQIAGSAKQLESQARNAVEDVKDMAQDLLK